MSSKPRVSPTLTWTASAVLLLAILLAPFFVVDVPAVLDYPNHLARFYILAHPTDPFLSKMYAPHWAVLPNVGMDLVGQALLRVLPVHVGGRILLALSLLAPLAGAVLYARAAFGRWTWWSLGVGAIAFNGVFFLGFMNFLAGLGVALAGAAAWRLLRRRGHGALTAIAGAAISLCAFFCHVLGFGFFAILVSAQEADDLLRRRGDGTLSWRVAAAASARLAVALGPSLVLYVLTHHPTQHGDPVNWLWYAKLFQLLVPFLAYGKPATIATAATVGAIVILVWRRAERASGVLVAWALLAILYAVAPFSAAGGTFLDTRLPLMASLLLFAGLAPRLSTRAGLAVAAALALAIVGRTAEVAVDWRGRAQDLSELRASLAAIPPGAKVLPVRAPGPAPWASRHGRALPSVARIDDHLPALAVIERHAFWPLLFADPGQQPVVVRPPYDRLAQPLGSSAPWAALFSDPPSAPALELYPYLAEWRRRFDYVLVLGPAPRGLLPSGLEPIRTGEAVSLYRVSRYGPN